MNAADFLLRQYLERSMKKPLYCASALLCALTAANAQTHDHHGPSAPAAAAMTDSARNPDLADAEVRRVDRDAGKITLRHGPIRNLDMPPMTMVFQVPDRSLLEGVQAGQKIRFAAEQRQGAYLVTRIVPVPN